MFDRDGLRACGLGTDGGQRLADGDALAAGVHLRWQALGGLGFPAGGFSVFRRRSLDLQCRLVGDNWSYAQLNKNWIGGRFRDLPLSFRVTSGPVEYDGGNLYLPGERVLELRPNQAVHTLVVTFDGGRLPGHSGEAIEIEDGEPVVVDAATARSVSRTRWVLDLRADHIDLARIRGTDIRVYEICLGPRDQASQPDWTTSLFKQPILLPVVAEGTSNSRANIVSSDAAADIARSRLSPTLDSRAVDSIVAAFKSDLYRTLTDLLAAPAQADAMIEETGASIETVRPAPTLQLRVLDLLAIASTDPNMARILGLYWHDPVAPDPFDSTYDYKVVGHWGAVRWPGQRITPADLAVGAQLTHPFEFGGITVVSPRPVEVIPAANGGADDLALRIEVPRLGAVPVCLQLSQPAESVSLEIDDGAGGIVHAFRGSSLVASTAAPPGPATVTLEAPGGIGFVCLYADADLRAVIVRPHRGYVGDLAAFTYGHRPTSPQEPRAVDVDLAQQVDMPAALPGDGAEGGTLAIRLASASPVRDVHTPVAARVVRTGPGGSSIIVNPERRVTVGPPPLVAAPEGWPAGGWHLLDQQVPAGAWDYLADGVDLFGRLGPSGAAMHADVSVRRAPPPPIEVHARQVGDDLLVGWVWPGALRVQAPEVEGGGRFQVLLCERDPNRFAGQVTAINDQDDESTLVTDQRWRGAANALAGERIKVNQTWFAVVGNTRGQNFSIRVAHLADPVERPRLGPFSLSLRQPGPNVADLTDPDQWEHTAHTIDVPAIPRVATTIAAAKQVGDEVLVTLADAVPTDPVLLPGVLVAQGLVWRATAHGGAELTLDGETGVPAVGVACTYLPGRRFDIDVPGAGIHPEVHEGTAIGLVGVLTSDRSGLRSRVSRSAAITAVHNGAPATVQVSLPDGDIPAELAEPADFYGIARYQLEWEPVADATSYHVMRATTAALFLRDREQRRAGTGHYATADRPFDAADTASPAWLAEHYPDLTPADLTTSNDTALLAKVWRDWAAWYYPQRLNREVMQLAEREGNETAFRRANEDPIAASSFLDQFDGRGAGMLVYRVRSVDASGNLGAYSPAFPLVRFRDVTPPATPAIESVTGAENGVAIRWRANAEPDLAEYRIWRAEDASALADVRRIPPHAVVVPTSDAVTETWTDEGLIGGTTWYYRLAAVDADGNLSAPTAQLMSRALDTRPPDPPAWEVAERVIVPGTGGRPVPRRSADDPEEADAAAIHLRCLANEDGLVAAFERRVAGEFIWTTIGGWRPPIGEGDDARRFELLDTSAPLDRAVDYRVRLKDPIGNINRIRFLPVTVPAP